MKFVLLGSMLLSSSLLLANELSEKDAALYCSVVSKAMSNIEALYISDYNSCDTDEDCTYLYRSPWQAVEAVNKAAIVGYGLMQVADRSFQNLYSVAKDACSYLVPEVQAPLPTASFCMKGGDSVKNFKNQCANDFAKSLPTFDKSESDL
jgi:hypothetical protein